GMISPRPVSVAFAHASIRPDTLSFFAVTYRAPGYDRGVPSKGGGDVPVGGAIMKSEDVGSVTLWIGDLKGGVDEATRRLWDRYYAGLVRLARARLRAAPRAAADEEDVALSAFDSFFAGV